MAAGASRGAADHRSTTTEGGCKFHGWSESTAGLGGRAAGHGRALGEVGFVLVVLCLCWLYGFLQRRCWCGL